jgi:hypothetical protein
MTGRLLDVRPRAGSVVVRRVGRWLAGMVTLLALELFLIFICHWPMTYVRWVRRRAGGGWLRVWVPKELPFSYWRRGTPGAQYEEDLPTGQCVFTSAFGTRVYILGKELHR